MKGYRTLAFNIGGAALIGALNYIGGIDWTQYVSATTAMGIVFGANTLLRFVSNTPWASKE